MCYLRDLKKCSDTRKEWGRKFQWTHIPTGFWGISLKSSFWFQLLISWTKQSMRKYYKKKIDWEIKTMWTTGEDGTFQVTVNRLNVYDPLVSNYRFLRTQHIQKKGLGNINLFPKKVWCVMWWMCILPDYTVCTSILVLKSNCCTTSIVYW